MSVVNQIMTGAQPAHEQGVSMSITQAFRRAVERNGSRPAIVDDAMQRSWDDLFQRCCAVAAGLRSLGVNPSDRVAVLAENTDEFLECFFAVPWAGAILVPINTRWSAHEIAVCLQDCSPRVLIADHTLERVRGVTDALVERLGITVVSARSGVSDARGVLSYQSLTTCEPLRVPAPRTDDDVAAIFYTGGTTGNPKGVMLSDRNLLTNAVNTLLEFGYFPGCVYLHSAPMFHAADSASVYALMLIGGCNSLIPVFEESAVLKAVERHRVNFLLLVPTMLTRLLDHSEITRHDLASLRGIIYGASPMPEALLVRAMQALDGVSFMQGYGMTELSPIATVLEAQCHRPATPENRRLRSAGRATFSVEIQIVDGSGRVCQPGAVGEIRARGPTVMKGYWRRPAETAEVIRDGWMCTGDAGYMDEDGFVYVVDRIKDMIISGGENIYSAEIENVIHRHAHVSQCAVIGIPDAKWGERVHAIVVPKEGVCVSEAEILHTCRERIAAYKCPKSVEIRREPLPLTAAGKVRKDLLRPTLE